MWKTTGKIAVYGEADRTQQLVTTQIKFKNAESTDLLEIEKVFFIPASVCASLNSMTDDEKQVEIAKWLVWQRYYEDDTRILIANQQDIAIEYTPTKNIVLLSAAIFSDYAQLGTAAYIRVMNTAGVVIAFSNTCSVELTTLYQLDGTKRSTQFDTNPTLKAGQTYYFAFNRGYGGTSDYYPARFQNEIGNYRLFNMMSTATPVDVSTWNNYIGRLTRSRRSDTICASR